MHTVHTEWPDSLDLRTICFTVDVEWAHDDVLLDLRKLFDQYGVKATFFVTHPGIATPGHERGLHPNFRRNGDLYKCFFADTATHPSDEDVYGQILRATLSYAPEAKGIRTHSLFYDSALLPIYRQHGIEYDCSHNMPFVEGIRPYWKHDAILAIPTYYGDHFDAITGATGFELGPLALDLPGIKVFDFHPNLVYINAVSDAHYRSTKSFYHDPARLLHARETGPGIRTLLIQLLESVAAKGRPTATAGEINIAWRSAAAQR